MPAGLGPLLTGAMSAAGRVAASPRGQQALRYKATYDAMRTPPKGSKRVAERPLIPGTGWGTQKGVDNAGQKWWRSDLYKAPNLAGTGGPDWRTVTPLKVAPGVATSLHFRKGQQGTAAEDAAPTAEARTGKPYGWSRPNRHNLFNVGYAADGGGTLAGEIGGEAKRALGMAHSGMRFGTGAQRQVGTQPALGPRSYTLGNVQTLSQSTGLAPDQVFGPGEYARHRNQAFGAGGQAGIGAPLLGLPAGQQPGSAKKRRPAGPNPEAIKRIRDEWDNLGI